MAAAQGSHRDMPEGRLSVTIERVFDAKPERVWRAWTDPDELALWFNEAHDKVTKVLALDVRPGGMMRLVIPPDEPAHPDVGSYVGVFLVVEPARELGLAVIDPGRWACEMVRFRFEADGDRTRMRFESTLAVESARAATEGAWSRAFDKLAARVAGGRA